MAGGRSQRHKITIQRTDSAGKGLSEKQPANPYIIQYANSQAFTVPVGPSGGPLQGSSMAGFPPTLIPLPGLLAERSAELTAEGDFSDPGQFNLSGNPIYTDLPESNVAPEPVLEHPLLALGVAIAGSQRPPEPPVDQPAIPEEPPARELPPGTVEIESIDDHADGLALRVPKGSGIKTGMVVTIEASGNSNVNGSYEVLSVKRNVVVIATDYTLTQPIEGKGRVSVKAEE